MKGLVKSDIHKDTILTTTLIVFARVADTVAISLASHSFLTFWTLDTTTVNISFILIFDSIFT